ncbi:MAG TPA: ABC transporter permease [Thermoanaerobaculia bacterium]|nr:ABC transporter permease [Thermoanaerobaculia bacterium]
MVDLSLRMMLHDRLRFVITVAGVGFAVALVLVQVGLFSGLLDNASVMIDNADADLWITSRNTPNIDFAHPFPDGYVQRVRSVPGVARADNLIVWFLMVMLPTGTEESVMVYATEDPRAWRIPAHVTAGRLEDLRRGNNIFLDESAVRRHGPFAVGEYREIAGKRMRIIGTTAGAKSFTTTPVSIVDFRRAQALTGFHGKTTYILVKLEPGADAEAVRDAIAARLPFNDVYTTAEWSSRTRRYWVESTGLGLNMIVTVFLGCLVGALIVAQTLYTSTMDHLREFVTVKAIGGSNGTIYAIVAKQALLAALTGFVAGAALCAAVRPAIEAADLKVIIAPGVAVGAFAGAVVLCLASSLLSFRKIATIDPALVFRT